MQRLVLVTGPPAAGKTTLARRLSPLLGLPLLSKDDFKEELFAIDPPPGTDRRAWSRRLSDIAWDSLFLKAAEMSEALIEGNVPSERAADILALHPEPVEVFCSVPTDVLIERLGSRTGRHPGHDDSALIEEIRDGSARNSSPVGIGRLVEVRTDQDVDAVALADLIGDGDSSTSRS